MEASLIGFVALLALLLVRIPLGVAMGIVGVVGFALTQVVLYATQEVGVVH